LGTVCLLVSTRAMMISNSKQHRQATTGIMTATAIVPAVPSPPPSDVLVPFCRTKGLMMTEEVMALENCSVSNTVRVTLYVPRAV